MKRFLAALRFLTSFPIPGSCGSAEEDLARSVPCFPLVGLLLGGLGAAAAWALGRLDVPAMLAALALVVLLLSFSGCLHLDGLSDSADGLLSSRSRDRMLEIMKDSHVGPMGLVAVLVILLAKFSALASMPPGLRWPAVLLMPLAGRVAIVVHLALLRYVRPGGLGTIFCQRPARTSDSPPVGPACRAGLRLSRSASGTYLAAAWALALLAAVGWGLFGLRGLAIGGVALAVMLVSAGYLHRKLGGITGDTLGAVSELLETVPAVTLAIWPLNLARWIP
jgi:adenosylcobinamide-GDP ribazoletransferase